MTALYLHIPFCLGKCHYCSFNSFVADKGIYGSYVAALQMELVRLRESLDKMGESTREVLKLDTLFVGGGTPTCLPSELLCRVVTDALALFGWQAGVEISVEANPGTINPPYLEALLQTGVNRLSLGVQSFNNLELRRIGRIHNEQEASVAIATALMAGVGNINLDLMYGLPGQTPFSWRESLEKGLSFRPQHLSLYQLTIEPGTPFYSLYENKNITLPEEEEILEMDEITRELCASAGLKQYEVSNYAVAGYECRHNINYWHNNDYLAAGASAVSCLGRLRERRVADPLVYIDKMSRNHSTVIETECLSHEESFRETVIMGLRMVQGISLQTLSKRYGIDPVEYYRNTLTNLIDHGFLLISEGHLRLTPKGWPLSNRIMAELV